MARAFGLPPSMRRHVPVMYDAAGESRKTIPAETSASLPKRCIGTFSATFFTSAHAAPSKRFSCTVRCGRISRPCGEIVTPCAGAR